MKKIFAILALTLTLAACSRTADGCTEADLQASRAAGVRDAMHAVEAEDLFRREGAILAIRGRETELREAGFGSAADAYVEAAEEVLVERGIIHADSIAPVSEQ